MSGLQLTPFTDPRVASQVGAGQPRERGGLTQGNSINTIQHNLSTINCLKKLREEPEEDSQVILLF